MSDCAASGDWEAGFGLFREMSDRGVDPTIDIYNDLLRACLKGQKFDWTLSLLEEMLQRGVEPDSTAYSIAISACDSTGNWEMALWLLQDMRGRNLFPDVSTYTSAICACEKGEQWEWAVTLFREVQEVGMEPTPRIYSAVTEVCRRCQQKEWVDALVRQMQESGIVLAEEPARPRSPARRPPPPPPPGRRPSRTPPAEARADQESDDFAAVDGLQKSARTTQDLDQPQVSTSAKYNVEDIFFEFDNLRGPAELFKESMDEDIFKKSNLDYILDLHAMNSEVAQVACFSKLYDTFMGPPDELMKMGLKIVVGSRRPSEGEEKGMASKVHAFLSGPFMFDLPPLDENVAVGDKQGTIMLHAHELRRVYESHPYFVARRGSMPHSAEAPPAGQPEPAIAEEQPAAATQPATEQLSVEDIAWELDQYKGPASIFEDAMEAGAFTPWVKDEEVVDLHGMSEDVAKVAVFTVLRDVMLASPTSTKLSQGLVIVVGKGLHSDDGRVIAPAVHKFLSEVFLFNLAPLEDDNGVIKLYAREIRRVHGKHPYFREMRRKASI